MPVTFPRDFPEEFGVAGLTFMPEPMVNITPLRSGRQISEDMGPTLWRGEWRSGKLRLDGFGVVRAWYDTLTSAEAFYGYDKMLQYPLLYRGGWGALTVGGGAFDGTCVLDDVTDGKVLDLSALPIGFGLSPGDYLSFDYGAGNLSRALHRISGAAVADGSGLMNVEVRPHIRTGWVASAVVQLYRASAAMKILPGSYRETRENKLYGRVSFEAIQTL